MGIYLVNPECISMKTGCYDTDPLSSFPNVKLFLSDYIKTLAYSPATKLAHTQKLIAIGHFVLDLLDANIVCNSIDEASENKVSQFAQAMKKANRITESNLGKEFDQLWYNHILEILKYKGLSSLYLKGEDFDALMEVFPYLDESHRCNRYTAAPSEHHRILLEELIADALIPLQLHIEDTLCDFFTGDVVFSNVNSKAHFVVDSSIFLAMNGFYRKGTCSSHDIVRTKTERVEVIKSFTPDFRDFVKQLEQYSNELSMLITNNGNDNLSVPKYDHVALLLDYLPGLTSHIDAVIEHNVIYVKKEGLFWNNQDWEDTAFVNLVKYGRPGMTCEWKITVQKLLHHYSPSFSSLASQDRQDNEDWKKLKKLLNIPS